MADPVAPPSSSHRPAWLEVDLDAVRHNADVIAALVAPAAVAPVVKANAYGHGVEAVAPALLDRAAALCVATLDEALDLRRRVSGRIVLLYPVPPDGAGAAVHAGVELTVMSAHDLVLLQAAAGDPGPVVDLHLCVETGMHRGGLSHDETISVAAAAAADPRFRVAGLWTHLASPEDPDSCRAQVGRFEEAARALARAGVTVPARHVAASGGIFCAHAPALDMVRPGLAVYGMLDPELPVAASAATAAASLRPAMSLKARAVAFSDVPLDGTVGYGDTWTAPRPSRVAILPVGYGDGYLRGTQPGAGAIVRGVRCPLVGRVSMDAVAVDVTDVPGVDRGDEFVLLGSQGDQAITATDLARSRNTIAWEVLSGMAARLARVYYPPARPD